MLRIIIKLKPVKKLSFGVLGGLVLVFGLSSLAQAAAIKTQNPTPSLAPTQLRVTDTAPELFPTAKSFSPYSAPWSGLWDPTPALKVVAANYFQQNYGINITNPAIAYGCWADYCYWTANAILWNQQANGWYVYRLYLNIDGTLANPNGQPAASAGPAPGLQGNADMALVIIEEPCGLPVCTNIRDMVPQIQQTVAEYNNRYASYIKNQYVTAPDFNVHMDIFFANATQIPNYLDQQAVINFARTQSGGHDYRYTVAFDINLDHTNNSHAPLGCSTTGNNYLDYSTYLYNQPRPVNWTNIIYPGKSLLFINLRGLFEHEFFGHCMTRWEHEWGGNEATMFWEVGNPFLVWTDPALVGAEDMQGDGMTPFLSSHPYLPLVKSKTGK
jgi:hypothetical protein